MPVTMNLKTITYVFANVGFDVGFRIRVRSCDQRDIFVRGWLFETPGWDWITRERVDWHKVY